jgi:Vitamin B12 dependent methionine synthase, activation domain
MTSTTTLSFSSAEIDFPAVKAALRVRDGSEDEIELRGMAAEIRTVAHPKAVYAMAFIEAKGEDYIIADGTRFTSRVLRINLENVHRCFPFVCTSGLEAEAWAETQAGFMRRFWADALNQAVLHAAVLSLQEHVRGRFDLGSISMMNPGSLADWPLREQRSLFSLLGGVREAIGVELTKSLLMVPTKSVSGIFFPAEESFASCQLCPRELCPNRRAPYDPELYNRKYRNIEKLDAGSWKPEAGTSNAVSSIQYPAREPE